MTTRELTIAGRRIADDERQIYEYLWPENPDWERDTAQVMERLAAKGHHVEVSVNIRVPHEQNDWYVKVTKGGLLYPIMDYQHRPTFKEALFAAIVRMLNARDND